MAGSATGARGASAAISPKDRAAWEARFETVQGNTLCPNCLDADNGTVVNGSLSLAPAQSQQHRQHGSPLRLHCVTCNRHLQTDKTFRCIVVTAEVAVSDERSTETLCTTDQFMNLSDQVAVLTTEIQKKEENERLRAQNATTTQPPQDFPLAGMVRDFMAQQATVAAEARATANESAAAVTKLTQTVNESAEAVARLAETVKVLSAPQEAHASTDNTGNDAQTDLPAVNAPGNAHTRPSFAEIAKRNLPQGLTLREDYESVMSCNARQFREQFVNPGPPSRPEHSEIPTTDLKPIYGSGLKHQAIGEIQRGPRSVLPAQATRGLSLFGTSSFELLAEESVQKHARVVLQQMGMKLTDQSDPVCFSYPSGTPVTDKDQLDRCAPGALRGWERAMSGCPFRVVKAWYQEQIKTLKEKFPHLENPSPNA